MDLGLAHVGGYYLSPCAAPLLMTAIAAALLGVAVLVHERASLVSLLFLLATLTVALWLFAFARMYSAATPGRALWWARIAYLGVPCIPAAFYHFAVVALRLYRRHRVSVWVIWGVSLGFVAAIVGGHALFTDLQHYWWGYYPKYGGFSAPYLLFFFGVIFATLRLYWREFHKAPPGTIHAQRLRSFLVASAVLCLGSLDYLAKYGLPLYPVGYVPVFAFLVLTARAVWKYRLVHITPSFAAHQIIQTMGDALVVLDQEGIIRIANHAACSLLGRQEWDLVGTSIFSSAAGFVTPPQLDALLAHNGLVQTFEIAIAPARSHPASLHISASVMRDQTGHKAAVVCIAHDVTAHKRSEEELRRANAALAARKQALLSTLEDLQQSHAELQAAQLQLIQAAQLESVGRLAAGVAHEVKNPLATLLIGVEHLGDHFTFADAEITVLLQDMQQAVGKANAVIKGLLDFSSPTQLTVSAQDLNAVLEAALVLVRHECQKRQIAVVRRLRPHLPPLALDRLKIEQAFINLLMNAVQAMPEGGALTLTTDLAAYDPARGAPLPLCAARIFQAGAPVVVAAVQDTGSGIPREQLSKVFDPFFTTKPAGQGTGLGLTVTRKIVELHGGVITVRNRPDGGTEAVLMFPAKGGEPHGQTAHSADRRRGDVHAHAEILPGENRPV